MAVLPAAKAVYLCDDYIGYANGKVDLYGLFNAIRSQHGFPHTQSRFCVFVQLANGLGKIPFFIDVRFAETEELVYTTETRILSFPNRNTLLQLAIVMEGCPFKHPGLYRLELFCDNTWVCDTQVILR